MYLVSRVYIISVSNCQQYSKLLNDRTVAYLNIDTAVQGKQAYQM